MYIVRWFIGHPIVAIWALTIIALLLSMNGGSSNKHEIVADSHTDPQTIVAKHPEHGVDEKAEASLKSNATTTPVISNNAQTSLVTSTETTEEAALSTQVATNDSLSPSASNTNITADQQVMSMQGLNDKPTDDLLLMAREAYWNNGLDEAAAIYQQLIEREPTVAEHKGELGNVYWKQGFPEKSATLYAEIAFPMIKNGHADRIANMVGFIELFHPDKAAEIKKMLKGLK
ncbi:MAG: tetratricopeptide repeat protein [Cocleimonas sp.]|nr:tetratricopeptide repeat protein [Cocleimonas sp.]